jgi:hypothetical protein
MIAPFLLRTIVVLLPHHAHARLVRAVQGAADRVYGAGRGPATWLIAAAGGAGSLGPLMLGERELALLRRWRGEELEALGRPPGGRRSHVRGARWSWAAAGRGIGSAMGLPRGPLYQVTEEVESGGIH